MREKARLSRGRVGQERPTRLLGGVPSGEHLHGREVGKGHCSRWCAEGLRVSLLDMEASTWKKSKPGLHNAAHLGVIAKAPGGLEKLIWF